ncbi:hypothetical protein BDW72DRAFT_180905, partial [Aspergillus terricola var. indicus]
MICGGHQVPAVRRRSRFDRSAELVEILAAKKSALVFLPTRSTEYETAERRRASI